MTERVTQTVSVRHEEVRVTREPITDADVGAATAGSAFTEEVYDVVLHAETPVVEKMVVPLERVRLDAVTVDGDEKVSADLRKEHIEVDDTTRTAGRASANLINALAVESSLGKPETTSGGLRKTPVKGKKGNRRRR